MGKRNNRLSEKSQGAKKSTKKDLASFDEEALSALTSKIEQGFEKQNSYQSSYNFRHADAEGGDVSATVKSKKSKSKIESTNVIRGAKRDADGNIKVPVSKIKKPHNHSAKSSEIPDKDILLREIISLGGTEEDLDLIADALSDDDGVPVTLPTNIEKSLRNELADFVAKLGIPINKEETDDYDTGESNEENLEEDFDTSIPVGFDVAAKTKRTTLEYGQLGNTSSDDANRLIFEPRPDWHAAALPVLKLSQADDSSQFDNGLEHLKSYAFSLLEADSILYTSKHLSASSSHRFLSTIMTSGTLSDKVSALTLVVQESPVHTIKSCESLLSLAKKRSRGQAVTALGALKDLFGTGVVLPADRRLKSFAAQPGLLGAFEESSISDWKLGQQLPGGLSKVHLISWAYEDWLKGFYFDVLKVLETWCNDEVEYARSRAVTYVYELLKEKPEQEANLLRLLVNKLGDPDKKIASRTSYLLLQLQVSHPLMKIIIIRSIKSELLFRPGQSIHARYYAINTLNQTILSTKEETVAKELLSIYFESFVSLLKKPEISKQLDAPTVNRKGQLQGGGAPMGKKAKAKAAKSEEKSSPNEELTEKMISAVLTGVNRAFPFSKADDITLEEHMNTLFRITHSSNFNTSVQALMLIEHLATTKHLAVDRFYRTLYESLLDPRLITSSKHALYLNLLFRSMKSDLNVKRVKAFMKRMLQVVTLHQPPFVCGVMYLLRELEYIFPGLKSIRCDAEEREGAEEESFHDALEDGAEPVLPDIYNARLTEHHAFYDGKKRDPEHSNADKSCLWELVPFIVHYHPSVALFAHRLLFDENMPPKPDLASHTLSSFLDRFVYRNAKASSGGPRGSSIMQPLAGGDREGILLSGRGKNRDREPMNSEAFWRKKAEDVAVDEAFFHKYFSQIGRSKRGNNEQERSEDRLRDGDSNEEEDEIWQALVNSRPEVEGKSDEDSDIFDLEESDEASISGDLGMDSDEEMIFQSYDSQNPTTSDFVVEGSKSANESDSDKSSFSEEQPMRVSSLEGKRDGNKKNRRKKLKGLPTFASAEDYAEMMNDEVDEDF